jgi:hypothetical protein
MLLEQTKFRCLSPRENYTERATDRRLSTKLMPTSEDRECYVVSTADPYGRFLDKQLLFLLSNSLIVLTRLSGPLQIIW